MQRSGRPTGENAIVPAYSVAHNPTNLSAAEGATMIGQTRTAAKRGFTVGYDPISGHFCGDLIAAAQPGAKIINYGNLYAGPGDFPILPKRLHLKCHSIFDTIRIPERRGSECATR